MRLLIFSTALFLSWSGRANCQGVFQAQAQTLSQQLRAEEQGAQQLMNLADKRFQAEARSGKDILEQYLRYSKEKQELQLKFGRAHIEVAKAENRYREMLTELKEKCQSVGIEEQNRQTNELTRAPVTSSPVNLAGTVNRLRRVEPQSTRQCLATEINQERRQNITKRFQTELLAIRQEQEDAIAMIQELERATRLSQEYTIRTRAQQRELFDYQEAVVRQMQARAISMAKKIGKIQQTGAIIGCFSELIQGVGGGGGSNQ